MKEAMNAVKTGSIVKPKSSSAMTERFDRRCDRFDRRQDFCRFPKHPEPKKVILECGCHSQDATFDDDDDDQKFTLASVVIDTTCLCRPQVKIEFSSLVQFGADSENGDEQEVEVDLLFKLVKICNGHDEVLQTWRYRFEIEHDVNDPFDVEISEPFSVTFCDRACPECCTYKMIVEVKDLDGRFDYARVVNSNISALAQSLCDC